MKQLLYNTQQKPKKRIALGSSAAFAAAAIFAGAFASTAQSIIVPNIFVRQCSYITKHCTSYHQTNGRYSPAFPSEYVTQWTWLLIF